MPSPKFSHWIVSATLLVVLAAPVPAQPAEPEKSEGSPVVRASEPSAPEGFDATEQVLDIALRTGEGERVLYVTPSVVRANLVMLPGGAGDLGLSPDGNLRHDENFVVRTRKLWVARGYAVLIPDAVNHANLRGRRSSSKYASIVEELVQLARMRSSSPVFLLGTSQGAIAAANGAAHAPAGALAGVILTESVSRLGGSRETVFDAGLSDIRVPALVVANSKDACDVAPPEDAEKIAAAMTNSPEVQVARVSGGVEEPAPDCGSLSPHGYYGIETEVVGIISDWIDEHLP